MYAFTHLFYAIEFWCFHCFLIYRNCWWSCYTGYEGSLGREPSQVLSVQVNSGRSKYYRSPRKPVVVALSKKCRWPRKPVVVTLSKKCPWPWKPVVVALSKNCWWPRKPVWQLPRKSSGTPLRELSITKDTSSGRSHKELLMAKDASSGRPLQLWLNQEATPWIHPAQIPLVERTPSALNPNKGWQVSRLILLHI